VSESFDLEVLGDVLNRLNNVGNAATAVGSAIARFDGGVELPPGVDLSGVELAVRSLNGVIDQAVEELQSLLKTVKEVGKADQSWGGHVKGWLTPGKTGNHSLDAILSMPGSQAAAGTDLVHDLGAGVVGLAADLDPYYNAYAVYNQVRTGHLGDPLPFQQPGLGFINFFENPKDSIKGAVGWQYHNDPMRFTTYAAGNLLLIFATSGASEVGEAAMAARLARLRELEVASARTAAEVDRLTAALKDMPASRQRNPKRRQWVRKQRRDAQRAIDKAQREMDKANAAQASKAAQAARLEEIRVRLHSLNSNRGVQGLSDAQTALLSTWIRAAGQGGFRGVMARVVVAVAFDLSSLGGAGQRYHDAVSEQPERQRLRELAAAHLRSTNV
jgi:hypothetical protein